MAYNVSGLTDYTQKATELFKEKVLFNDNLSKFDIQTGIQDTKWLNKLAIAVDIVAGGCSVSVGGSETITERKITVKPLGTHNKVCQSDLDAKALSDLDVEGSLTQGYLDQINKKNGKTLWQGLTAQGLDGWLTQLHADGTLNSRGATATLTTDNIDDAIYDMITNMPEEVYEYGEVELAVSQTIFDLYKMQRIQANQYHDTDSAGLGVNEMKVFGFSNIKMVADPGLTGIIDDMVLTVPKLLVIGTDELFSTASAKWEQENLTEYMHFITNYKLGTSYHDASLVTTYK